MQKEPENIFERKLKMIKEKEGKLRRVSCKFQKL